MEEKSTSKIGGLPANTIVIPLAAILVVLFTAIVFLVIEVNRSTNELSDLMRKNNLYQQEASDLRASTSLLSETASNFAQMPLLPDNSFNTGTLVAYAQEYGSGRRGYTTAENFHSYDVSKTVRDCIDRAASCSDYLLTIQLRVIALVRSAYDLPPIPALDVLPDTPLDAEELAMSDEARAELAKTLVRSQDYGESKQRLNENITLCMKTLQEEFDSAYAESSSHISAVRATLWAVIFEIILILVVTFTMFYHWLVMPLRRYVRLIKADKNLEKKGGVRELRLVAMAYNDLLQRRNKLEGFLRSAAETDALTGMPNRYSLECSLLESGEDESSMTVLLFDVNYLKKINDTQGHLAGDKLLRTAGACICECFGENGGGNCYRIGGDEFAAVLRSCSEEQIKDRLDRFALAQEREGISVSVGSAYAEKVGADTFKELMDEADKRMYEQKKRIHGLN